MLVRKICCAKLTDSRVTQKGSEMFLKPMLFSIATGICFSWGPIATAYKVPSVWVASLATSVAALIGWVWFFSANTSAISGVQVAATLAIGVMMGLGVMVFSSLLMLPGLMITTWIPVTSGLLVLFPVIMGVCWIGESVSSQKVVWITVILIGIIGLTRST